MNVKVQTFKGFVLLFCFPRRITIVINFHSLHLHYLITCIIQEEEQNGGKNKVCIKFYCEMQTMMHCNDFINLSDQSLSLSLVAIGIKTATVSREEESQDLVDVPWTTLFVQKRKKKPANLHKPCQLHGNCTHHTLLSLSIHNKTKGKGFRRRRRRVCFSTSPQSLLLQWIEREKERELCFQTWLHRRVTPGSVTPFVCICGQVRCREKCPAMQLDKKNLLITFNPCANLWCVGGGLTNLTNHLWTDIGSMFYVLCFGYIWW